MRAEASGWSHLNKRGGGGGGGGKAKATGCVVEVTLFFDDAVEDEDSIKVDVSLLSLSFSMVERK